MATFPTNVLCNYFVIIDFRGNENHLVNTLWVYIINEKSLICCEKIYSVYYLTKAYFHDNIVL